MDINGTEDLDFLEQLGKAIPLKKKDGNIKHVPAGGEFGVINDSLTGGLDSIFGPNQVDSFDASCNTCKHFQRKPMDSIEKKERNLYGMPGHCALKDIPVRGWQRGQYCGFENAKCYENRRTGMRPHEACILKKSE